MECQSGKFHYGFLFAQLTEEELSAAIEEAHKAGKC